MGLEALLCVPMLHLGRDAKTLGLAFAKMGWMIVALLHLCLRWALTPKESQPLAEQKEDS